MFCLQFVQTGWIFSIKAFGPLPDKVASLRLQVNYSFYSRKCVGKHLCPRITVELSTNVDWQGYDQDLGPSVGMIIKDTRSQLISTGLSRIDRYCLRLIRQLTNLLSVNLFRYPEDFQLMGTLQSSLMIHGDLVPKNQFTFSMYMCCITML